MSHPGNDVVLRLEDVCVRYPLRGATFARRPTTWSLEGVSLELHAGETLGVVGRNGSGKTTLLRTLADIIEPDRGRVTAVPGRRLLLALTMGFVPHLSGRMNAVITGLLLGETHASVRAKLPEMIAFGELGEYIDNPVSTYSAGMRARLAFSVAFHTEPEILLVDELLGVGDEVFRKRSAEAMRARLSSGRTAVLAAHSEVAIRSLCDRVVWLEKGRVRRIGPTDETLDEYLESGSQLGA